MKDADVISGSSVPGSTSTGLLARLRAQDREAWIRFANLYGPLAYRWCRQRGLRDEDSADIVQEVFRAVALNVGDFRSGPDSSFRGWLWTIARSKMLDHYRRHQRQPGAVGGEDARQRLMQVPETPELSDSAPKTSGNLVRRALAMIQPEFTETTWQAFWSVVMEDQPVRDVALKLGISTNSVYIAKSRILRRLRDELGEFSG